MKTFGILTALAGGALLLFGTAIGFPTDFGTRVMNLPMAVSGGALFLAGVYAIYAITDGSSEIDTD